MPLPMVTSPVCLTYITKGNGLGVNYLATTLTRDKQCGKTYLRASRGMHVQAHAEILGGHLREQRNDLPSRYACRT